MSFTRRSILTSAFALTASSALGQTLRPVARPARPEPFIEGEPIDGWWRPYARPEGLGPSSADIIQNAGLSGQTAVIVTDLSTGEVLDEVNADQPMPPASTLKMVTAAYALDHFPGSHRFETQLLASETPQDGVLNGDLILQGSGDPLLDTDALIAMGEQAIANGLREINGSFLLRNGIMPQFQQIDPNQPPQVPYNPAIAGLNLNFNRVHLKWQRAGSGYDFNLTARSTNHDPSVSSIQMRAVDRGSPIFDHHGGTPEDWSVARSALGANGSRWLPVRSPRLYAGDVFRKAASARGLSLPAGQLADGPLDGIALASHLSDDLTSILNGMLRFSANITAEVAGVASTTRDAGKPESLPASAAQMAQWAQTIGLSGHRFIDHSGLGGTSRLTPRQLTALISTPRIAQRLQPIAKDQPIDLLDRTAVLKVKTGTLNFVSALTGYIPIGSRMLAFTIFSADLERRNALTRFEREAPAGGAAWNRRAKALQEQLLQRWALAYM